VKKHKWSIAAWVVMLLIVGGIAWANLSHHSEALLDALITYLDGDYDGVPGNVSGTTSIQGSVVMGSAEANIDGTEVVKRSFNTIDDGANSVVAQNEGFVVIIDSEGSVSTMELIGNRVSGTEYLGYRLCFHVTLADGAQLIMPVGISGHGTVSCPDGGAYASFIFTSAGAVTIMDTGANNSTTEDNDTTLNIFDDGSGIGIENELGAEYTLLFEITAYLP
jgi:hypothetical protein